MTMMVGHNVDEGLLLTPPYLPTEDALDDHIQAAFANGPSSSVKYITQTLYPPVFDGSLGYTNNFKRGSLLMSEVVSTCNPNFLSHTRTITEVPSQAA
jgi:hypothetical protein